MSRREWAVMRIWWWVSLAFMTVLAVVNSIRDDWQAAIVAVSTIIILVLGERFVTRVWRDGYEAGARHVIARTHPRDWPNNISAPQPPWRTPRSPSDRNTTP